MIKFSIWLEGRKKSKVQGPSLFDSIPEEEPTIPLPKAEPQNVQFPKPKAEPQNAQFPKPKVAPQNVQQKQGMAIKAIPVQHLLSMSQKDPQQVFTLKSFGRVINVKDLHSMQDNNRVVGYDDKGHRYLVSRNPNDKVLFYPN